MSLRNLLVIVFQSILSTDNALASRVELLKFNPLSATPTPFTHKMGKHTPTTRRVLPTN